MDIKVGVGLWRKENCWAYFCEHSKACGCRKPFKSSYCPDKESRVGLFTLAITTPSSAFIRIVPKNYAAAAAKVARSFASEFGSCTENVRNMKEVVAVNPKVIEGQTEIDGAAFIEPEFSGRRARHELRSRT